VFRSYGSWHDSYLGIRLVRDEFTLLSFTPYLSLSMSAAYGGGMCFALITE
jgi:hypothetical protein